MLNTKLHRPPLTAEHVFRYRLIDELNKNIYKPLSLICAPAGYGKSMLASSWIEGINNQSVWLSLSEDDNDLRTFTNYIVAAIQKSFPEELVNTEALINASELPSVKLLAQNLINELDHIQEDFIVVIDDYHLIHDESIHQLIDELLRYPPEHLHLCLLTRRDPALRIRNLRIHNRMTEIRMEDLSFSEEEIFNLFKKIHGIELKSLTVDALQKTTEGWVTALRMISLASVNTPNIEKKLATFKGDLYTLSDFLTNEILSGLPDEMKNLLYSTALLGSFCFDLLKSCYIKSENNTSNEANFDELFDQLIKSDLFLISLDDNWKWFRYHHLFQQNLINHLSDRFDSSEKASIYLAAANWFEKEGMIDQALENLLKANEAEKAGVLVSKHAHAEFIKGVGKVESWLNKLPPELREINPSLVMLKAWHAFGQFHMERIPPILEKVNELIKDKEPEIQINAELSFFQGNFQYWMGDTEGSLKTLSQALNHYDLLPTHVRCNIELVHNMALQKSGAYDEAVNSLITKTNISDNFHGFDLAYLYGSLTFLHLLSGKLRHAHEVAKKMELHSKKIRAEFLLNWSYYLQALANLQLFQTEKALRHFEVVGQKILYGRYKGRFRCKGSRGLNTPI